MDRLNTFNAASIVLARRTAGMAKNLSFAACASPSISRSPSIRSTRSPVPSACSVRSMPEMSAGGYDLTVNGPVSSMENCLPIGDDVRVRVGPSARPPRSQQSADFDSQEQQTDASEVSRSAGGSIAGSAAVPMTPNAAQGTKRRNSLTRAQIAIQIGAHRPNDRFIGFERGAQPFQKRRR